MGRGLGAAKRDAFASDARAPLNQRPAVAMPSTLIITNDFPPWVGGIESFVSDICDLLDYDVVVYTSGVPGATTSDRERPFRSSATDRCCCRRHALQPVPRVCSVLLERLG
jgi:hypothetical protein